MCNQVFYRLVQRPSFAIPIVLSALCCLSIIGWRASADSPAASADSPAASADSPAASADSPAASAETVARLIGTGNVRGAAVTLRQALIAEPGSPLLRQEAATLLLLTGDVEGASVAWRGLLAEEPTNDLALYASGVIALQKGDRTKALEQFRAAMQTGDRAVCMIAERYLESVTGASGAGLGLVLPDTYICSARGLSGLAAGRLGDAKRASVEIGQALALLPGDPYYETPGIVMSCDPAAPVRFGFAPLPQGHGLAVRQNRSGDKPYSGTLQLAPNDPRPDAGFVVFKIDGALVSMVNTRPFQLAWDSTKVSNGSHRLEIVVYDRQGVVLERVDREIRTSNVDAPTRNVDGSGASGAVRSALWQALAFRPSRHALAYSAAEAAEKLGNRKAAIGYFELAAAIDPDFRDTRARLSKVFPSQPMPPIWRGDTAAPTIALTFDDGPKPGISEKLVDLLVRERVPATFFVIGRHVAAYPELLKKISDAGFQIENHTYTHPNMTMLSPKAAEIELLKTVAAVYAVTGRTMRYFRPPGGNTNPEVTRAAARWGLTPCMWTVDADSLENGSPDKLVEYVTQRATPGSIVLLHNGRKPTLDALPRIIAGLRQRGFRFDTIDGLLARRPMSGRLGAAGRG